MSVFRFLQFSSRPELFSFKTLFSNTLRLTGGTRLGHKFVLCLGARGRKAALEPSTSGPLFKIVWHFHVQNQRLLSPLLEHCSASQEAQKTSRGAEH